MKRKEIIGIIGGGQLGRMLTEAALPLGFNVIVLDPTLPKGKAPAALVGAKHLVGGLKDAESIRKLAGMSDYLTWEIEHINTDILEDLMAQGVRVSPHPSTLKTIQDKYAQKEFLTQVGVPVAPFMRIEDRDDIKNAAKKLGYPLVLKARFGGYDGRGNFVIKSESDIEVGLEKLGYKNLYVEGWLEFEKELAVIAARDVRGNVVIYPVVETEQQNNICHTVKIPADITKKQSKDAQDLGELALRHLNGAGVIALEMFLTKDGRVVVNEIAPRVHNSGHATIEANQTSQFTQHILAITGRELGSTALKTPAVMVNILGDRIGPACPKGIEQAQALGDVFVHIYGKDETKPERKMGHITVIDTTLTKAFKKAKLARELIQI